VANSSIAPFENDFKIDANGAYAFIGHFLCGVETAESFVNVHLHCIVRKMSTLPHRKNFCGRPWLLSFTLSARFDVWAGQAKLTMYEIEN